MSDLSKVFDMGFIVDTPPTFVRGALGPYVRFSDGQIHYLTFLERIQRFLYRITADDFQENLRPGLTHNIKAYKQSQAYAMRNKQASVSHTNILRDLNNIPVGLETIQISKDSVIQFVPAQLRMKYFVWIRNDKNMGSPQLWAYDHSVSSLSGKPFMRNLLRKEELIGDQQTMSIDELVNIYPCPEIENER